MWIDKGSDQEENKSVSERIWFILLFYGRFPPRLRHCLLWTFVWPTHGTNSSYSLHSLSTFFRCFSFFTLVWLLYNWEKFPGLVKKQILLTIQNFFYNNLQIFWNYKFIMDCDTSSLNVKVYIYVKNIYLFL